MRNKPETAEHIAAHGLPSLRIVPTHIDEASAHFRTHRRGVAQASCEGRVRNNRALMDEADIFELDGASTGGANMGARLR